MNRPPLSPLLARRFKLAFRRAIEECGGFAEAARVTGYSLAQLARWGGAAHDDLPRADVLLILAEHTGARCFADLFADLAGCRLTAAPIDVPGCQMAAGAECLSEAAELIHQLGASMRDGVISPREDQHLRRVFADVRAAIGGFEALLPDKGRVRP